MDIYDIIVIGGGPGGYVAAIEAAHHGAHVALVEERELGGTCLNRGCIPTKALIHTTGLFDEVRGAAHIGLIVEGAHIDIEQLFARKDEVVSRVTGGVGTLLSANGVDVFHGHGTVTARMVDDEGTVDGWAGKPDHHRSRIVEMRDSEGRIRSIAARDIVVATGSAPSLPPIPGLDLPGVMTSDDMLGEAVVHESLVIIGGGVIGIEMACIQASLGVQVTIIEALDRLLAQMDREISQTVSANLRRRGVEVFCGAMVEGIERDVETGDLRVRFTSKDVHHHVEAQAVLAALGRRPYTEGLLDGVEVERSRGAIIVDGMFRTSVPGLWAIGDVIGGAMLAHKAEAEGVAVADAICGHPCGVDTQTVPSCVYVSPEIASVGLTEAQARGAGHIVEVGKYPMGGNARTLIADADRGFMKLVFDASDDRLLGATLLCERATDLISEMTTAIVIGATREQLGATMRPHPTFSEGLGEAIHASTGEAIHLAPRRKI